MEKRGLLICGVVGLLGLVSVATGFGAEATRIKVSEVQLVSPTQCAHPRSPALALGLTAILSLLIAQIIINMATGCFCCKKHPDTSNSNWTAALACFIISWFTFVIAFFLLLTAAALNERHGEDTVYYGNYYCYIVKPGVFAGGAVLSLSSIIIGIFYYLTLTSAKSSTNNAHFYNQGDNNSGIAMGRPQFPPQSSQDPVFVHEDTYHRRQFP